MKNKWLNQFSNTFYTRQINTGGGEVDTKSHA